MIDDPILRRDICAAVRRRLGFDLIAGGDFIVDQGLERLEAAFPGPSAAALPALLDAIGEDGEDWERLAAALTVGETFFFRDTPWLEALERHVLLPLISRRRAAGDLRLRIWSAGCSTGEEPYSLAMLLDRLLPDRADWSVTLLASDVNPASLRRARSGVYRHWALRDTPPHLQARYFKPLPGGLSALDPSIRRMVAFRQLNLIDPTAAVLAEFAAMDLIVCRNVVMYFGGPEQRIAAATLSRALADGGWLAVTAAEASASIFHPLKVVHLPDFIGFTTGDAGDARPSPEPRRDRAAPARMPQGPRSAPPARPAASRPAPPAAIEPEPGLVDLAEARALADAGRYDAARVCCERALALRALDGEGHLLHAQICQQAGDLAAARASLRKVLYLQPESALGHFLLGNLRGAAGEIEAARRSMETVLDLLRGAAAEELDGEARAESHWLRHAAEAYLGDRHAG